MTPKSGSVKPANGRAQLSIIAFIAIVSIVPGMLRMGAGTPTAMPGAGIKLDPNRATREELMLLPGIGPKLADTIIDERTAAGADAFSSTEDLDRVPRIGPKTIEKLRPHLNAVDLRSGATE